MTRGGRGEDRGSGADGGVHRVGDILGNVLRKLGIEREVAGQEVLLRWDEAVGEGIARVAQAKAVSRGTLFVEVASSAWISELTMMRRDLIAKLNAGQEEGRVERIVFSLAEKPDWKGRAEGGDHT